MTDPRAALADIERLTQAWHMTQRCVHGKGSGEPMQTVGYLNPDREVARDILDEYARLTPLAERGVLLVNKDEYDALVWELERWRSGLRVKADAGIRGKP